MKSHCPYPIKPSSSILLKSKWHLPLACSNFQVHRFPGGSILSCLMFASSRTSDLFFKLRRSSLLLSDLYFHLLFNYSEASYSEASY